MAEWLVKSEPEVYSIDDLRRDKRTRWDGVRNYQARNFLREMRVGDEILFYHSSCDPAGVVGRARVSASAVADTLQFDPKSEYFDGGATKEKPRWFSPEIAFVEKYAVMLPLEQLRKSKALAKMVLLQRGSRLSVQPVSVGEFSCIKDLAKGSNEK